ncbi:unnamed protein product [Orchesella dallaii]|uniref:Uncharacterized protein n=1 Tax=Orchesella dallaii TaxID=48710 RepID=A0ABP1S8G1_9HEXA
MNTLFLVVSIFHVFIQSGTATATEISEYTISHLEWLKGFDNCLNFVFASDDISFTMRGSTDQISKPVPYMFYHYQGLNNRKKGGKIHSSFRRWTTCHSISFIPHFNKKNVSKRKMNARLLDVYINLGYQEAEACIWYGRFCSLNVQQKTSRKFFAVFSAAIFYIIPAEDHHQNEFKLINYRLLYKNHALQKPFKITYPVVEVSKFEHAFGKDCFNITFMCQFCGSERLQHKRRYWLQPRYRFQDFNLSCASNVVDNYGYLFSNLYWTATKDGMNFTYFKAQSDKIEEKIIESTDIPLIKRIQHAKTARNVLFTNPKLDEIILSILLEKMPKDHENLKWVNLPLLPGVGAISVTNWSVGLSVVPMESRYFNFVSCAGKKLRVIHPFAYFDPFEPKVWLLLGIALLATVLLVHIFSNVCLKIDQSSSYAGSITMYIVALLLNTSSKINETQEHLPLRRILAVWLLTSIIISNAYRGDNFSKTTVPLWGSEVETFEEMLDFTFYTTNTCSDNRNPLLSCATMSFDIVSWFINVFGYSGLQLLSQKNYDKYLTNISNLPDPSSVISINDKRFAQFLLKIKPVLITSVDDIINHIGQCQKTAFIEENKEIQQITTKFQGISFTQRNANSPIGEVVPYLFYQHKNTNTPTWFRTGEIESSFRHWTTCHSISFIIHFSNEHKIQTKNLKLNEIYSKLGFEEAHDCIAYGQFCSLLLKHLFGKRYLALVSITMFYILPAGSHHQNMFKLMNFDPMYGNYALQKPFKITYPIEVRKFENVFGKDCVTVTFMCKFCDFKKVLLKHDYRESQSGYPFQDFDINCVSTNFFGEYKNVFADIYWYVTKDGKNFTYFKLDSDILVAEVMRLTDIPLLTEIQYAKSANYVMKKLNPKLDEIILSILLERMPKHHETSMWADQYFIPAVGAVGVSYWSAGLSAVPMESRFYNFISCHGKNAQILRPSTYTESFEPNVWLLLMMSLTATILIIHIFNYFEKFETRMFSFNFAMYVIALLLNTCSKVNESQKPIFVQIILAGWLLNSIIISNAYRGDNFSKTTVPVWRPQVETFEEMLDFKFFTKNTCSDNQTPLFKCATMSYEVLCWFLDVFGFFGVELLNEQTYDKYLANISNLPDPNGVISISDKRLAQLFLKIKPVLVDTLDNITNYIGQCQKTAFIEENKDIQRIITKYRKSCNEYMYVGKETLFLRTIVWNIQENGGQYMRRRMRYLEDSGLHKFWKQLMDYTVDLVQNVPCPKTEFQRVSLTSKVSKFQRVFGNECVSITFMCKFCDSQRFKYMYEYSWVRSRYPFQDFNFTCTPSKIVQTYDKTFTNLYWNFTQDGMNFTYFKLVSEENIFELTDISLIEAIQNAKTARIVLLQNPKLDEITLSILLERMLPYHEKARWYISALSPAIGAVGVMNLSVGLSVVPMESRFYNFISCDGNGERVIQPFTYFKPFELQVWCLLMVSLALTCISIFICNYLNPLDGKLCSCNAIMYIFALLLNTTVKINEPQNFRRILAVWLLTSIIISNAYRGDNFSKTTIPTKTNQVETFDEMIGFTFFTKHSCPGNYSAFLYCATITLDILAWLPDVFGNDKGHLIMLKKIDEYLAHVLNVSGGPNGVITASDKRQVKMLLQIQPVHLGTLDDLTKRIGQCEKTAFIEENKEIQRTIYNYRATCNQRNIYVGKERLFLKTTVWNIQENGGYYMIRRMRYLESSGVHQFWKQLLDYTADLMQNVPCPKKIFSKLYLDATGDGNNFTYSKLLSSFQGLLEGENLKSTTFNLVQSIRNSKNFSQALLLNPDLDEIVLSILIEKLPSPQFQESWTYSSVPPALGAVHNLEFHEISVITMQPVYFNFITCSGKHFENPYAYLDPFDKTIWLLLLLSILLTAILTDLTASNLKTKCCNCSSALLIIFAVLLNTYVDIKKLYEVSMFRRFLGVWLLTSIILSNAYKGDSFSKTTIPSKPTQMKNFGQLSNFKLFIRKNWNANFTNGLYYTDMSSDIIHWLAKSSAQKEFQFLMGPSWSPNLTRFKNLIDKQTAVLLSHIEPVHIETNSTITKLIENFVVAGKWDPMYLLLIATSSPEFLGYENISYELVTILVRLTICYVIAQVTFLTCRTFALMCFQIGFSIVYFLKTIQELPISFHTVKLYTHLEVCLAAFEELSRIIVGGFLTFAFLIIVLGFNVTILGVKYSKLSLPCIAGVPAVVIVFVLCCLFKVCSLVYDVSGEIKLAWMFQRGIHGENKLLRKKVESCHRLSLKVGSVGVVDTVIKINFFNNTLTAVVNLMLALAY